MRWWTRGVWGLLAIVWVLVALAAPARAQQRASDAKREFLTGREAYEKGDYASAYDHFKRSYVLSMQPALLYNIASALQGMGRPGEAADALRDYVKAMPADPERPLIEKRIAALDDAQRLTAREEALERERARAAARASRGGDGAAQAEVERLRSERQKLELERERLANERLAIAQADRDGALRARENALVADMNLQLGRERARRRNTIIGVTIGTLVVVGVGVGLAVGLTRQPETPHDLGPYPATP